MFDRSYPGRVLFRQQALARAPMFQIETAIVQMSDGVKRVFKRALHPAGLAHLQRMADNRLAMHGGSDQSLSVCACRMHDRMLEMEFVEGINLQQKLIQAIDADSPGDIEHWLTRYIDLVSAFDNRSTACKGPADYPAIFGKLACDATQAVHCGNIDQGFDHWIVQPEAMVLIDYEWVLGFPVPLKYVLYRSAQLFFQNVPVSRSPQFRLRDMCAFFSIDSEDRMLFDRMEAHFQHFVRHQAV